MIAFHLIRYCDFKLFIELLNNTLRKFNRIL